MQPNTTSYHEDDGFDGNTVDSGGTKRLLLDLLGRWYWIVLGLVLGGSGSLYYLSKAPRQYASSCTLLVKEQVGSVLGKDQADEMNMRSAEAMNTIAERLKRQVLLERVASREDVRALQNVVPAQVRWLPPVLAEWLGDDKEVAAPVPAAKLAAAALAGSIGSWMSVSVRRGTRLLDLTVTHPTPEVVKVLADAICLEYIAEISGAKSSGRTGTIQVLASKSEESRQSLQAAQKAFSAYQRALASHEELQAKEKEVAELNRRYRAKHPELINGLAQVTALQSRFLADFDASVKSGADAAYWKESEAVLKVAAESLPVQLENARRMLLSRTAVLRSEIQSQESVFNAMLTRMEQVEINQSDNESELEISSLAGLPGLPVSPVSSKILMIGLMGGLAFGGAIAFGSVRLDNKFHTVMQLEELLQKPVLAAVSFIKPVKGSKAPKDPDQGNSSVSRLTEKNWDSRIVFRQGQLTTTYAEMFRVLRASITLLGPEAKRKVTLFTSAIPGEGKSLVSVNCALAAAGQGRRTLLIDFDLRRPSVHHVFGISGGSQGPGVTGYLSGKTSFDESVTRGVGGSALDVMLSGDKAPNPGELLNGAFLTSLLEEARAKYEVVVLDTAPLLAVPDTRVLAPYVDNVCLVVRAEYVPKGATERVMRLLAADRTPLSGLVLNGFLEHRSRIASNYSYGYYKYGQTGNAYGSGDEGYGAKER